jgi:hypothetical protein
MIAGNYSNNFQFVPHWLWDMHLSPAEFLIYMALRSFAYPVGPRIDELVAKTGFTRPVVEQALARLQEADLAAPCLRDQFGERCDDRWVFNYLKNAANAPDRAPAPVPDLPPAEDMQRVHQALLDRGKALSEEHQRDWAELHERVAQQDKNLNDPTYLRSPGPINPDICGMVDQVKHAFWCTAEGLAEMHYRLAELTGLGLLDPDANNHLQDGLVALCEHLYRGTLCAVRDPDNGDDVYYDEFDNTFGDGHEIRTLIRIEPWEDSAGSWEFNAFVHGDGATNDYPRGTVYHVNPVRPTRDKETS